MHKKRAENGRKRRMSVSIVEARPHVQNKRFRCEFMNIRNKLVILVVEQLPASVSAETLMIQIF